MTDTTPDTTEHDDPRPSPDTPLPASIGFDTEIERLLSVEPPTYVRATTQESVFATLDAYGVNFFLEEIARGTLPNVLALRYEQPIIMFNRWLNNRASPEEMAEAKACCAQSMVAKGQMVLTQTPSNATGASMMRAYAAQNSAVAEKLDPDTWGKDAGKDKGQTSAPAVNIQINGFIPGMEALADPENAKRARALDAVNTDPLKALQDLAGGLVDMRPEHKPEHKNAPEITNEPASTSAPHDPNEPSAMTAPESGSEPMVQTEPKDLNEPEHKSVRPQDFWNF